MSSTDVPAEAFETVWLDSNRFADAERRYYETALNESKQKGNPAHVSATFQEVPQGKQVVSCLLNTKKQEQPMPTSPVKDGDTVIDCSSGSLVNRMEKVEQEQNAMKQEIEKLTNQLKGVLSELSMVKDFMKKNNVQNTTQVPKSGTKATIQNGSSAANDDDLDLFGSDEENEDDVKVREERLKAYAEKKSKKPALVAKSSVVLDVKPWDDETDMKAMETAVRNVTSDGLVWGASKLVPLAYGIKKLQIVAIVEDEKVSIDWLQETIQDIEDLVQSVDIAAFNKL